MAVSGWLVEHLGRCKAQHYRRIVSRSGIMKETSPPVDAGADNGTVRLVSGPETNESTGGTDGAESTGGTDDTESPVASVSSLLADDAETAPDATSVDDLVVVSNRQPYRHDYEGSNEDEIVVDRPAGGLTAGLDPVLQRLEGRWVAWGDGEADRAVVDDDAQVAVPPEDPSYTLERVWLTDEQVEGYYEGYSNQALWPLCHLLPGTARFEDDHWEQYEAVNQQFAERVAESADADSTIWFQDYHFALAPRMTRAALGDDAFYMQFWHIPWPAPDAFRLAPQRAELLRGLLGNDLLGFHVADYGRNFLECVEATLDEATVNRDDWTVEFGGHTTAIRAFPLNVDASDLREKSRAADGTTAREFRERHSIGADTRLLLGVDRLDYTKGIPKRLEALERFFEDHPEHRGEVTYVQKGCRSRSNIPAYKRLQSEVSLTIDRLSQRFGTDDWQPVVYTDEMVSRETLCALYRDADAALVSPLCDGMNLVAQEYVASQVDNDGVLLLSEFAGAHEDLGESAVTVNPYDTSGFADAIERTLAMDEGVRESRMAALRRQVHDGGLDEWVDDVLSTASEIREGRDS